MTFSVCQRILSLRTSFFLVNLDDCLRESNIEERSWPPHITDVEALQPNDTSTRSYVGILAKERFKKFKVAGPRKESREGEVVKLQRSQIVLSPLPTKFYRKGNVGNLFV